ncbi:hypothetical protein AHAS_Ahas11G0096700 [Arachis hypogaea]
MDHMASNDPSICVQGSYDTSDDMSDHSKSIEINVPSLSEDDTQRVDKDFVTCEEVAAMLHSGLDDLRAKLFNYRANLGSKGVATTQNSMRTQSQPGVGANDI